MPGLIYELIDTLNRQIVHFDELIALSAEKKELIIKNDTDELSKLTTNENAITGKLLKLDKTRASLMEDIANVIGRPKGMTLSELSEAMRTQAEYEEISGLTEITKEKLKILRMMNDQNKILIDNSLEYISFTINAIRSSLLPEKAIYSSDGEELGTRQSFFDAKQ